ncbi:type VI secretion system baseplate subunit TssK [Cupriavidus necator]
MSTRRCPASRCVRCRGCPPPSPCASRTSTFALDSAHPAFKRMLEARACQFYVPASMPDVSLELFAVLPA